VVCNRLVVKFLQGLAVVLQPEHVQCVLWMLPNSKAHRQVPHPASYSFLPETFWRCFAVHLMRCPRLPMPSTIRMPQMPILSDISTTSSGYQLCSTATCSAHSALAA